MKHVIISLMLVAMFAFAANATSPGGPWQAPFQWGTDCLDWEWYDGPDAYNSGELIYNPGAGEYIDCATQAPVVWPQLYIDYFLELETIVTFDWTQVQVHRASNYEDVILHLYGTISSNQGNYIIIEGTGLDVMEHIEAVVGGTGAGLPVTWEYSLDSYGPWSPMTLGTTGYYFIVPDCDHYFWIRITIDVEYHQAAGYYALEAVLCPIGSL